MINPKVRIVLSNKGRARKSTQVEESVRVRVTKLGLMFWLRWVPVKFHGFSEAGNPRI